MPAARILLVEEDRSAAAKLRALLESLGYRIAAAAARGETALRQAGRLHPDLILMSMRPAGGARCVALAQAVRDLYRIPVVFLASDAGEETLERVHAAHVYGLVIRPCKRRELHAALQMALARHRADALREHTDTRLALALEAAELGAWSWDPGTGQVAAEGRAGAIFGEPSVPPVSSPVFLQRVHPADRAGLRQALERAAQGGHPAARRFRYRRLDGSQAWIEAHGQGFAGEPGSPATVVGVLKDITEQARMQERLRQASAVFDSMTDAVLILDPQCRIHAVNAAFSAMTGFASDAAAGAQPDALLHTARRSDSPWDLLRQPEAGPWQTEGSFRRSNGEAFSALERVSAVRDPEGVLTHYVMVLSDISALRRAEAQLKHVAHHDPLTGLPNRLLFNDRLDTLISGARRRGRPAALLSIDLDGFKVINDTLGHASGDRMLQAIAGRLAGALRPRDIAARIGGDEFVVIPARIESAAEAMDLAARLLQVLGLPIELGAERITVTASIGLALYPDHGADCHALLRAADTAMYNAKSLGRNRVSVYTPDMAGHAAERLGIEQGLRRALESSGLMLHYQPLVALNDGQIAGVEALLRWEHPEQGLITPERFIGIAEESGLIEPLGRWVLQTACAQMAPVLRARPGLRLSVNVSARQLGRPQFEQSVREVLRDTGVRAGQLELEITESTLQVIEDSRTLLSALKSLGLHVAIDDFGTGFSSLSVIKHLPIDRLKIDRSFVRDIPGDANDVAIVETISTLSHTLGLNITAEGVETCPQLDLLTRLGCHEAQGYLFSRPQSLEALHALMALRSPWGALFPGEAPRLH